MLSSVSLPHRTIYSKPKPERKPKAKSNHHSPPIHTYPTLIESPSNLNEVKSNLIVHFLQNQTLILSMVWCGEGEKTKLSSHRPHHPSHHQKLTEVKNVNKGPLVKISQKPDSSAKNLLIWDLHRSMGQSSDFLNSILWLFHSTTQQLAVI